jgi:hypothetical protein
MSNEERGALDHLTGWKSRRAVSFWLKTVESTKLLYLPYYTKVTKCLRDQEGRTIGTIASRSSGFLELRNSKGQAMVPTTLNVM